MDGIPSGWVSRTHTSCHRSGRIFVIVWIDRAISKTERSTDDQTLRLISIRYSNTSTMIAACQKIAFAPAGPSLSSCFAPRFLVRSSPRRRRFACAGATEFHQGISLALGMRCFGSAGPVCRERVASLPYRARDDIRVSSTGRGPIRGKHAPSNSLVLDGLRPNHGATLT